LEFAGCVYRMRIFRFGRAHWMRIGGLWHKKSRVPVGVSISPTKNVKPSNAGDVCY
jgi:hypothetical protein